MNDYPTRYVRPRSVERRRPRRHRLRRWVVVCTALALGVYGVHHYSLMRFLDFKAQASADSSVNLSQRLTTIMKGYPQVQTGVSLINLQSNRQDNFGVNAPFTAASTTKLITAAAFLQQVEQGNYSLNGPLGDYTAGWQLQQLVQESDNDSWQLFIGLLGGDQIQNYAHTVGLSSFDFNANTITPADEATLLAKLYQGKLLNQADTKLLLGYMQHTNDQELIPAALPAGATVYHKYGELLDATGNYVHDAAIVVYQGHSFVLTIYTDRTDMLDYQHRLSLIHAITRAVVGYETGS